MGKRAPRNTTVKPMPRRDVQSRLTLAPAIELAGIVVDSFERRVFGEDALPADGKLAALVGVLTIDCQSTLSGAASARGDSGLGMVICVLQCGHRAVWPKCSSLTLSVLPQLEQGNFAYIRFSISVHQELRDDSYSTGPYRSIATRGWVILIGKGKLEPAPLDAGSPKKFSDVLKRYRLRNLSFNVVLESLVSAMMAGADSQHTFENGKSR